MQVVSSVPLRIVSVGYQGRRLEEMAEGLRAVGVSRLVDVRLNPWSQRPEFRKGALAAALERVGVGYVHAKIGGNPFRATDFATCAAQYRNYLETHPTALAELAHVVLSPGAAVLCYEEHHTGCHRGVLVDALVAYSGVAVELAELPSKERTVRSSRTMASTQLDLFSASASPKVTED